MMEPEMYLATVQPMCMCQWHTRTAASIHILFFTAQWLQLFKMSGQEAMKFKLKEHTLECHSHVSLNNGDMFWEMRR